jgi:hypothetical protein
MKDIKVRLMVAFERRDTRVRPVPLAWRVLNRFSTWWDGTRHDHVEVYFPKNAQAFTSTAREGVKSYCRSSYNLARWDVFHMFVSLDQYELARKYANSRVAEKYEFCIPASCWGGDVTPTASCHGFAFGILSRLELPEFQSVGCPMTPGGLSNLVMEVDGVEMLQEPPGAVAASQ